MRRDGIGHSLPKPHWRQLGRKSSHAIQKWKLPWNSTHSRVRTTTTLFKIEIIHQFIQNYNLRLSNGDRVFFSCENEFVQHQEEVDSWNPMVIAGGEWRVPGMGNGPQWDMDERNSNSFSLRRSYRLSQSLFFCWLIVGGTLGLWYSRSCSWNREHQIFHHRWSNGDLKRRPVTLIY